MIENAATYAHTMNVVLSVDGDEWYYGRPENRLDHTKRKLISGYIQEDQAVSKQIATTINELFNFVTMREHDTLKRKARSLYVDANLLRLE